MQYAPVPDRHRRRPVPRADRRRTGAGPGRACSSCTTCSRSPPSSRPSTWCSARSLIAGLALVLLVLAIALLVTRQVVKPVRVAAQTAGPLAAGDLAQRIKVRGTDDIARLGQSFNDMAGSLQRQIRRLEDLSRLQRRFTSDVSHELRTPLTTIRMAAELLHATRDEFTPELARSAELLHAELDRFEALLADLLEISRYDAGVARLESEPTDLRGRRRHRRRRQPGAGRAARQRGPRQRARRSRSSSTWTPAGSNASCATCWATPSTTARAARRRSRSAADEDAVAVDGSRPRRGAAAGRGRAGVQPLLARRPVAQPAHRRHRPRAWRSAWRTPACTTAGCRPGASAGAGRSSG